MQPNKQTSFINIANHGITLIEIMLILIIISIFTSIIVRVYLSKTAYPTYDNVQQEILTIKNAMKFYKLDNGFYPTTAQGISALVIKPTTQPIPKHWTQYLKKIPTDQWGHSYHYENPGKDNEIDIYSDSSTLH